MAYTKAPLESTDKTVQIPLLQQWYTRTVSNTKDIVNKNVIWEIVNGPSGPESAVAWKRDGTVIFNTDGDFGEKILALYSRNEHVYAFGGFGVKMYDANTGNLLVADTSVSFIQNPTYGGVHVTEFQYEDGTVVLVVTDGVRLCLFNDVSLTQVTDPDLPNPHLAYPVYLDGYLFLADLKGTIWNSDLNDPTSWSPSNFIMAEGYPDSIRALARHGVYIVAFGDYSIQFFYDAANATGSPLAAYSASNPQFGFIGGLANYGDVIFFLGFTRNGVPSAYKLEGFKVSEIGNPSLSRRLSTYARVGDFLIPGVIMSFNGHDLFVYHDVADYSEGTFLTYAYDIMNGEWLQLENGLFGTFRVYAACRTETKTESATVFVMWTGEYNYIFKVDRTSYIDVDTKFMVEFTTKNLDFGSRRMKFGNRLLMTCDQTPSASYAQIQWSDDDYQTWSVSRNIDVSQTYTQMYRLGSFRKRAFKVRYHDVFPMRFSSMELDYSIGQA